MTRVLLMTIAILAPVAHEAEASNTFRIIGSQRLAPPVRHALTALRNALKQRGLTESTDDSNATADTTLLVIGTAADDRIGKTLARHRLTIPAGEESLLIQSFPEVTPPQVLVAGRDDRGLSYALYEVAQAVEAAPRGRRLTDVLNPARESPFLRTRSLQVQVFNEDLEREWYIDEQYWHRYFSMLAACRFNRFTLTFGHQTNYMNPVYAWLVRVPEYPDVRVRGLTEEERRRNLRMLERISRLAWDHGIEFTLGVWTQQPVEKYGRTYIENFPGGLQAADYCARALALVLEACPMIKGVQFRMNVEAGIPEDQQNEYFRQQFRGVLMCPRPVRMDLRYKGLRPETISDAVATGRDVTVSTKFWCEHMGLPFHPTIEDDRYRESRYGYGAMLYKPRDYRVVYRMWTVGSQRLLLWGDPDYAARFAQSCKAGGGEGFEVFAPLSNKGFGNAPGNWSILADKRLRHFEHEYERYWHFHQAFGRAGYNPDTSSDVWSREFRSRFGSSAAHVEKAFRHASQIIPLLTATKLFGASEWRFWPEMSTGGQLDAYMHIQPSDYGQFYAIKKGKPVPGWLAEPWESKHRSFVEDALADRVQAKWTPIQVAARLNELAETTETALQQAGNNATSPESRLTRNDLLILANLARYHAHKTLAATELAFHRRTREAGRLVRALAHIRRAASSWEGVVRLTDGVYPDNLVFGYSDQRAPAIDGVIRAHTGHWKDRLPEIQRDVAAVEKLLKSIDPELTEEPIRQLPGEVTPASRPVITHMRRSETSAGQPLEITASITCEEPLRDVILHHRRMDQTVDWKLIPMKSKGDGRFTATIPGQELTARYDHLYYIEARIAGGGTLWPDWQRETPYVVVTTMPPDHEQR